MRSSRRLGLVVAAALVAGCFLSLVFVPGPLAGQDDEATVDAVADVIAEQAPQWNRGDLDGSMAILAEFRAVREPQMGRLAR